MAAAGAIIQAKKKVSFGNALVRVIMLALIVLGLVGHKEPVPASSSAVDFSDERPAQSQCMLNEDNLPADRDLPAQLPDTSASRPVQLAAFYAASQNQRLDSLRKLLPRREYAAIHRGLVRLWWNTDMSTHAAAQAAFEARKR